MTRPGSRSATSRASGGGRTVTFPPRTFRKLEITVDSVATATNGLGPVGFAEVGIGDRHVDELVRMPVDLLKYRGHEPRTTTR